MKRVRQLLRKLGLERYADAFEEAGYDDARFLLRLSADDAHQVAHDVGMMPGHAHKFVHMLLKPNAPSPAAAPTGASVPLMTNELRPCKILDAPPTGRASLTLRAAV